MNPELWYISKYFEEFSKRFFPDIEENLYVDKDKLNNIKIIRLKEFINGLNLLLQEDGKTIGILKLRSIEYCNLILIEFISVEQYDIDKYRYKDRQKTFIVDSDIKPGQLRNFRKEDMLNCCKSSKPWDRKCISKPNEITPYKCNCNKCLITRHQFSKESYLEVKTEANLNS
jgi:hypothetical protein